jgi:Pectate lyase superfamily protein
MSSEKHPNLQLHKWAPTDYVKREEWNENFGIIDDKIGILNKRADWVSVKEFGAKGDGVTDDTQAIQNAIDSVSTSTSCTVFFPTGTYLVSSPLTINNPNTRLVGENRGKIIGFSAIVANHQQSIIVINIASGKKGAFVEGLLLDGNNMSTVGIELMDNTFGRNYIRDVIIQNINGTGILVGNSCYGLKLDQVFTSNVLTGIQLDGRNMHVVSNGCQFLANVNSAVIGNDTSSDSCQNIIFTNCDLTVWENGGIPVVIRNAKNTIIDKCWIEINSANTENSPCMIQLGTSSSTAINTVIRDCFIQANSRTNAFIGLYKANGFIVEGNHFDSLPSTSYCYDASNSTFNYPTGIHFGNSPIASGREINGQNINSMFKMWLGDSATLDAQWKTIVKVDTSNYSSPGYGSGFQIFRKGESYPRVNISETAIAFSSGASPADVSFIRYGASIGGMSTGQSFRVDGTWNGGHLLLGNYHIWVDSSGRLRIKNGAPTSDTDGVVVGAQT